VTAKGILGGSTTCCQNLLIRSLAAKKANNLANNWVPERPNPSQSISPHKIHTPSDLHI
jgi:hypothetical protein